MDVRMDKMDNSPFWEFLTEEECAYHKKFMACTTIEELQQLGEEMNAFFEDKPIRAIEMPIEEFKKKFDLIDIKDLKGKYGF